MQPILIPNFSRRNEFIQMLREREAKLGVEVGTDHGVYAKQLCEGIPELFLYCIDPWTAYIEGNEVKYFNDNSLDFVFIDGNHSYDYVLEDITEWTKKVKPGGIIAGHDYKLDAINKYGVIEAVNKYVKDNHIAPWFIMQKRGFVDCWCFFKQ